MKIHNKIQKAFNITHIMCRLDRLLWNQYQRLIESGDTRRELKKRGGDMNGHVDKLMGIVTNVVEDLVNTKPT
jgi:hypothetical protein